MHLTKILLVLILITAGLGCSEEKSNFSKTSEDQKVEENISERHEKNYKRGFKYDLFGCNEYERSSCVKISDADYKNMCNEAEGITNLGISLSVLSDPIGQKLNENGQFQGYEIRWDESSKGENRCRVKLNFNGIVSGLSIKRSLNASVSSFVFSSDNHLLINHISNSYPD